jgi:hypothetical protein
LAAVGEDGTYWLLLTDNGNAVSIRFRLTFHFLKKKKKEKQIQTTTTFFHLLSCRLIANESTTMVVDLI